MTVVAPERPTGRSAVSSPCLTNAPHAGMIIAALFAVTVALFLLSLLNLAAAG